MKVLLLDLVRARVRITRCLGGNVHSLENEIIPHWYFNLSFREMMKGMEVTYGDRYSLASAIRETQE